jgi:hypothetical protein
MMISLRTVALPVFLVTVLIARSAFGQDDDLNSDRPGVGTNAFTVPRGALQLEAGLDYARERRAGEPTQRRSSIAGLLRYGLLDGVELRVEGEPVVRLRGAEDATDAGDFVLSAKLRLVDGGEGLDKPTIAILPAIKVPTAPEPVGTEKVDALVLGLVSFGLGRVGVDFNAGLAAIGQEGGSSYVVQGLIIGSVTGDVTDRFKLLGELLYASPSERGGDHSVVAVAGAVYALTRRLSIDTAFITSLAGRGPDYRLQAGFTARFGP